MALLIFGEFLKESFTLFRIGAGSCFVGLQGSPAIGEFPEQRLTLFCIERDLLLRFSGLGKLVYLCGGAKSRERGYYAADLPA